MLSNYILTKSLAPNDNLVKNITTIIVPDRRSRDLEVVVVRRIINLGSGNLEWGGNEKVLRKGRSVYE